MGPTDYDVDVGFAWSGQQRLCRRPTRAASRGVNRQLSPKIRSTQGISLSVTRSDVRRAKRHRRVLAPISLFTYRWSSGGWDDEVLNAIDKVQECSNFRIFPTRAGILAPFNPFRNSE